MEQVLDQGLNSTIHFVQSKHNFYKPYFDFQKHVSKQKLYFVTLSSIFVLDLVSITYKT